jgi:hypothetical protein
VSNENSKSNGNGDNGGNGRTGKRAALSAEAKSGGERAVEDVREFLEQDGWFPERMGDAAVFRVQYSGRNATFPCFVQVRVELEQLLVYAVCPVRTPEEARSRVAEFITRANYGMRIGNFELDYDDGEVRYKTSVDFEGEPLTVRWLRGLLYPAVQTLDTYLPGLLAVAHGERSPLDAVKLIEEADE